MVFLAKGQKTYQCRVDHPDGRHVVLTTRCTVETDARDIEGAVRRWQGKKGRRHERLDVVAALVEKRLSLPDAYDAEIAGRLDVIMASLDAVTPRSLADELSLFVDEKSRAKKGAGQAETYRKQITALYPDGITLANFTKREVWSRIEKSKVDAPTRNRFRSACSMFAKHLVKREIIETNFVRDIGGDLFGENDPRLVYYEITDAKKLIGAMPQPYAAISAMALAFCAEWGAITRALVGDFTLDTDPVVAHIRGTKRQWRDRHVPLVPELAWTLAFIRPALKGKTPSAHVIQDVPEWRAIDVQRAIAVELGVKAVGESEFGPHSIHDWRHTSAVALLRAGRDEQIVAAHLGHKDTALVRKVYGRFKPTRLDYAKSVVIPSIIGEKTPRASRGGKRR